MKKLNKYLIVLLGVVIIGSCKKGFLEEKPSSNIVTPVSVQELNMLLENQNIMNQTAALPQISADEYRIISEQNFYSLPSTTSRNGYVWAKDIYEGETNPDWDKLFKQVFYCNSVLKSIEEHNLANSNEGRNTKGWALFCRAYAYFDLTRNFSSAYRASTAETDLGMPLRLTPNVDETKQRSSLKQTLELILKDLDEASSLLISTVPENNRNRPSKAAAFALKARIGIYIGDYKMAELAADSSLKYHDKLVNYNSISRTSTTPFAYNTPEIIFHSSQIVNYSTITGYNSQPAIEVEPDLLKLYESNDLRKSIFFMLNTLNKYNFKRGYVGAGLYSFTGLACDEIYLIKAECLARRGETNLALQFLDRLLINRYIQGTFIPSAATNPEDALALILLERRKELVWRAIRWSDIKRLNIEGRNINLSRQVGQLVFTLPANDLKFTFPIPENEIAMSGITQNIR